MRYVLWITGIIAGVLIGCSKEEDKVVVADPPVNVCPLQYEERVDSAGRMQVFIEGYWLRCHGYFGVPRMSCIWRLQD